MLTLLAFIHFDRWGYLYSKFFYAHWAWWATVGTYTSMWASILCIHTVLPLAEVKVSEKKFCTWIWLRIELRTLLVGVQCVRFEIITVLLLKTEGFWGFMPCWLVVAVLKDCCTCKISLSIYQLTCCNNPEDLSLQNPLFYSKTIIFLQHVYR
jgi:hypothetical protein